MRPKHLITILVLAILVVVAVLVIITRPFAAGKGVDGRQIAYRLKWLANTGFAGDLVADTYGYFREEGLQVVVKPGGPEKDAIREISTGQAKFGVASADQVIQALSQGADIVVVSQVYQRNPVAWIYRSGKAGVTVTKTSDLAGRRVGVTFGDNDEAIMNALLKKHGVASARQDQAPEGFAGVILAGVRFDYQPFLNRRVDFFPVYVNTQGVDIKADLMRDGEEAAFFAPDAHGIKFVANSIVTSARTAREEPDLVRRFVKAAMRGWRDVGDPEKEEEVVRAVTRWGESVDRDVALTREKVALTRDLIKPPAGRVLGYIDASAWQQTEDIMVAEGLMERPAHVVDVLRSEFVGSEVRKVK